MRVISKSKKSSDNFDVIDTVVENRLGRPSIGEDQPVGLNIDIETALSLCKDSSVTLRPSAVQFLLDKLGELRQYEAEEYNRQIGGE